MTQYAFQTITAAQAAAYSAAADSLSFGDGAATRVSVAFSTSPEQISITLDGVTLAFGPGIYGDQDLRFANGGSVFIGSPAADNGAGGAVADAMFGGAGGDTLSGGDGADLLQGNQGADSLVGGAGDDSAFGGQDNDVIVLGTAAGERNWSNGNKGDDFITGAGGIDTILGGQGNDSIAGGGGADLLVGNLGDDTIRGGAEADTILGEGGYDVMTGGGGADTFVFAAGSSDVDNALADRILDWSAAYRISLPVRGGYAELAPTGSGPPPGGGDPYGYGYIYADDTAAYSALSADEFAGALAAANNAFADAAAPRIVAVQRGLEVVVFVDTDANRAADLAIVLVGVGLDALDASNFI